MPQEIDKAVPRSLYVSRTVLNGADLVAWAKSQGFKTTLPAEDLHVTVCYSRRPLPWTKIDEDWHGDEKGHVTIRPGGPRAVSQFKQATVLEFASSALSWRHEDFKRAGATWDHPEYLPHITISYDKPADLDVRDIKPYQGEIVLGPEIFQELDEDWRATVIEKAIGADEQLGIVFGWAIVSKFRGEDYYDLNVDPDGSRVPEHIPEDAMLKAAAAFMDGDRPGNEQHSGPDKGKFLFAFPLTTEIAKALGIETDRTGLIVGYKATPETIAKVKAGKFTGFSIEGARIKSEGAE